MHYGGDCQQQINHNVVFFHQLTLTLFSARLSVNQGVSEELACIFSMLEQKFQPFHNATSLYSLGLSQCLLYCTSHSLEHWIYDKWLAGGPDRGVNIFQAVSSDKYYDPFVFIDQIPLRQFDESGKRRCTGRFRKNACVAG